MKNISLILLLILTLHQSYTQERLPIIDMHLHAMDEIWSETRLCFPEPCNKEPTAIKDIAQLLPNTIEKMDKYNIVLGVLSGDNLDEVYKWGISDERFITSQIIREPMRANLVRIEKDIVGTCGAKIPH